MSVTLAVRPQGLHAAVAMLTADAEAWIPLAFIR